MAELNEAVAEVAEEVADQATTVAEASRALSAREMRFLLGGLAFGAGLGFGLGFLWTRRRLETKYERIAENEIDQMREHFRKRVIAKEGKPDIRALDQKLERLRYEQAPEDDQTAAYKETDTEVPPIAPPKRVIKNPPPVPGETRILAGSADDGWDWEAELAARDPEHPYVIHIDECGEKKEEYDDTELIYYSGDDVLCDVDNKIVDNKDLVVGLPNLNRFGHGSGDKNTVFIRNEKLTLDIEVSRMDGSYAEEVHGITHSDTPRHRRPQWDE